MLQPSDVVTIRRLPDGDPQSGRMKDHAAGRLIIVAAHDPLAGFDPGTLVEVQSDEALYLGEVTAREPDSQVTVAVEHFLDRATLAEIEKGWQAVESA